MTKKRKTGAESRAAGRKLAMQALSMFADEMRLTVKKGDRVLVDNILGTVLRIDRTNTLWVQLDADPVGQETMAFPWQIKPASVVDEVARLDAQKVDTTKPGKNRRPRRRS